MTWNLFLDDERDPSPTSSYKWVVARSVEQAKSGVKFYGLPTKMSLDHDLGEGPTGHDFVKWLCAYMLDQDIVFPEDFNWFVHSQNPVGAQNINNYLDAFVRFLRQR